MTKADFQVAGISDEMENNYNYFITSKNSNYFLVVGIQVIGKVPVPLKQREVFY